MASLFTLKRCKKRHPVTIKTLDGTHRKMMTKFQKRREQLPKKKKLLQRKINKYKKLNSMDTYLYKNKDIVWHVHNVKVTYTQEERDRIEEELDAFRERGMYNLLRYMVYLVDFMRENDIVWGVGRGSSVASYVLYLIGVHRINSIQY